MKNFIKDVIEETIKDYKDRGDSKIKYETLEDINETAKENKTMQKSKITCKHCGYEWTPRKPNLNPIRCPLCQKLLLTKEQIIEMRKGDK